MLAAELGDVTLDSLSLGQLGARLFRMIVSHHKV